MSGPWVRTRLKFIADVNLAVLPESTDKDFEFTYVDIGSVTQGRIDLSAEPITFKSAPSRARRLGEPGDIIVSTVRTYLRAVAPIPASEQALVFSTGFALLHPAPGVDSGFLAWYVQGDEFVSRIEANSTGVSYPAITAAQLMTLDLHLPPLAEQRAIADYLDHETAQIDTLIAKQEQLIATLRERRGALLDWLVLSVERPSVPLRHFCATVTVGIVVQPSQWYADEGVPALRGTNVKPERLDLTDLVYLSREGHEAHAKSALRTGDVVVVRTGQSGAASVVPEALDGSNAIDLLLVRPNPILRGDYLAMVLNAPVTRELSSQQVVGTIQGHLNVSALRALPIRVPALDEQDRLIRQWRSRASKIDALIAKAERFIELSKERRAALITAAVTGQIDVQASA